MAEPSFPGSLFQNTRQRVHEVGALGYQLLDNVIGFDDNYDTTGELLARALREDPIGTTGSIASGMVDSVKAAYEDPLGTLSEMGSEFVTAFETLSSPMDMDASREEIGQRLEAASLLGSVIPVAGAGLKAARTAVPAVRGLKPRRLPLETRSPDLIDEISPAPVDQAPALSDNPFDFPFDDNPFEDPYVQTPFEDPYVQTPFEDPYVQTPFEDPFDIPFNDPILTEAYPLPVASAVEDSYVRPYATGSQDIAQSPLRWLHESGENVSGLYSRAARAAYDLRQPTYGDIRQLVHELEARGAPPKEMDLYLDYLADMFDASPTGKLSKREIQSALRAAPGMDVIRTSAFADIGPAGGQNYTSTAYVHPMVDASPPAASRHFRFTFNDWPEDRYIDPLLHSRAAQYQIAPDGNPATTHHVLEIQSDWAQFRQLLPSDNTPEARTQAIDKLIQQGRVVEAEIIRDEGLTRAEFDELYPAPFVKNEKDWVDVAVRQNLLDAVNSGSDWITFGNANQAAEHIGMPKAAAERFYDHQVPMSVERVLRKFSREAGIDTPEFQDVTFVDGQSVKGLRITPELRQALIKTHLPSFRDGGMVTAGEILLAGKQN